MSEWLRRQTRNLLGSACAAQTPPSPPNPDGLHRTITLRAILVHHRHHYHTNLRRVSTVRCGPRDNRGPLLKGRILSTEAIQAIQSLKRAYRTDPTDLPTHLLSRLIKSDLTAAFKELLRQDQCALAIKVFSTIQSEYGADLNMYAELVLALARNGMSEEIDPLIGELEKQGGGIQCEEGKGLLRLVKALIGAQRKESTVRIYGMMKRSGWGSAYEVNEYLGRVLSKGLRRFGEVDLADEIDQELGRLFKGILVKPRV
ncbi:protein THYLAKOID ASSEMBLY 8, chloroplastic [Sesamum angolense]|uniref:Protein THYLAKOID ASSEMBLY 8, chloroplastic n=1 Tax=Sesamum angolense TaxID=2727404 RepID=A0AAE1XEU5_9LAMI|nr:protein THYLAKOID ASSEMBLY 8, chloroplastic [Sesamum angolense]